MSGWLSTWLGRFLRAIIGLVVLAVGMSQVSVLGILVMLTGLVMAVTAVAHPGARRIRL